MTAGRMKPLSLRRLTPGEQGFAAEMFGDGLDASRVRILALPIWSRAFVAGPRLVVWPAATAPCDFSAAYVPLGVQAVFVHELTHVWQYEQRGLVYVPQAWHAQSRWGEGYDYGGIAELARRKGVQRLSSFGVEQQGNIMRDYYLLRENLLPLAPGWTRAAMLAVYAYFVKDASTLTEVQLANV